MIDINFLAFSRGSSAPMSMSADAHDNRELCTVLCRGRPSFLNVAANYECCGSRVKESTANVKTAAAAAKRPSAKLNERKEKFVRNTGKKRWIWKKGMVRSCQRYLHWWKTLRK